MLGKKTGWCFAALFGSITAFGPLPMIATKAQAMEAIKPSSAERARVLKASDAAEKCASASIPTLDDGISPANLIAHAVRIDCALKVERYVLAVTRAEMSEMPKEFRQSAQEIRGGLEARFMMMVLQSRVAKRSE